MPPTLLTLGNLLLGVYLCAAVAWGGATIPLALYAPLLALAVLPNSARAQSLCDDPTNVRIDFGISKESTGFYLQFGEAF